MNAKKQSITDAVSVDVPQFAQQMHTALLHGVHSPHHHRAYATVTSHALGPLAVSTSSYTGTTSASTTTLGSSVSAYPVATVVATGYGSELEVYIAEYGLMKVKLELDEDASIAIDPFTGAYGLGDTPVAATRALGGALARYHRFLRSRGIAGLSDEFVAHLDLLDRLERRRATGGSVLAMAA